MTDFTTISKNDINFLVDSNDHLYSNNQMRELYQKLWSNISVYSENCSTVYYSPSGYLANINFDLLVDNEGVELGDKINLIRISSTGNIPNFKSNSKQHYTSSCIYGNISYDESLSEMNTESSKYSAFMGKNITDVLKSRSQDERGKWGGLPYTKNEIDSISAVLNNSDITIQIYEEKAANEESFKALDGKSADIIHMATHGFVINTHEKALGNKFVESTTYFPQREGYMMWCGLMMAGANNAWTGNFNMENVEDGILTADEISRINLSNTKLVVLSACETARGITDPVEGVFGLQRAFKKAGAQTIVMSLWKVPDESTSILMTHFYKELISGVECHHALKNAMNYVKALYPDPYYWAGFIILD